MKSALPLAWGRLLLCGVRCSQTWKGMTRLIFSPTFLMNLVLSWRGRRIFGYSETWRETKRNVNLEVMEVAVYTVCVRGLWRSVWVWVCPCMRVSLTHDLSDDDRLFHDAGGAASSDVHSHHSEQELLSCWQPLHTVRVLVHWLLIGFYPVIL